MSRLTKILGFILMPLLWIILSYFLKVPENYLPSPLSVIKEFYELKSLFLYHFSLTAIRLAAGMAGGIFIGILIGYLMFKYEQFDNLFQPFAQSIRAIPPVATIPFFLLWFGFSDKGKVLMLIVAVSVNLAFSGYQILYDMPEKYRISLLNLGINRRDMSIKIAIPLILEKILPTLRFALVISIASIITIEMIGSQSGLGYLIQTARTTFNLSGIFVCVFLLAILSYIYDTLTIVIIKKLVYWERRLDYEEVRF
ncbi:ABC transporter permease [Thermotomaculum hydrothermale]|nr:ABC transporter permease subunit [Thermotomaculum hydrothermale]